MPPVITLIGEPHIIVHQGEPYEDAGAVAVDDVDGNLTPFIEVGGSIDSINTDVPGVYVVPLM